MAGSNSRDAHLIAVTSCIGFLSLSATTPNTASFLNESNTLVFHLLASKSCEGSFKGVKVRSQISLRRCSNG